jgi:hypothetical protein
VTQQLHKNRASSRARLRSRAMAVPPRTLDKQQIELIGRSQLVTELLRDGLEVALPERDRGIDLIAYVDLDDPRGRFLARPIQLKARTSPAFSVASKYERFPSLLLAYLWHVDRPRDLEAFFMTYEDAYGIAVTMNWTKTASWAGGLYRMAPPSLHLLSLLEPYRMAPGRWRSTFLGPVQKAASPTRAPGR